MQEALVSDIVYDMILRVDFMKKHEIVVDVLGGTFCMGEEELVMVSPKDTALRRIL